MKLKGYGRRSRPFTAFSTFKYLFGEHSLARTLENITRKLVAKVVLYNMLINLGETLKYLIKNLSGEGWKNVS